jgi:hypothetical protein
LIGYILQIRRFDVSRSQSRALMLTFTRTSPDSSIVIGLRALLTVLIAISVAALPAIAEGIVLPSRDHVTMADQAEMPCCPSCDTQGDFKATACVLKCAAVASAVLPARVEN